MNRQLFFPNAISSMLRDLEYFPSSERARVRTAYSINEDAEAFNIELDLPGVKKENINISVKEDTLNIVAEKKKLDKEDSSKEIVVSRFEESFSINSNNIDLENIDAKLEDGILTIKLPKKEELRYEKKIEVK